MKQLFLSLFIITSIFHANKIIAQSGWLWGRGNLGSGNDAYGVASDPAGNVFASGWVLGSTPNIFGSHTVPILSPAGSPQVTMVKYDPAGNVVWALGTQHANAWLYKLAADKWGNSYMFGSFSSDSIQLGNLVARNSNAHGSSQFFLAKFDPAGNVKWIRIGASNMVSSSFYVAGAGLLGGGGVCTDDTANVYIVGDYTDTGTSIGPFHLSCKGSTDVFVAKYDSSGNIKWATDLGDSLQDQAYSITSRPDGNIYIIGQTQSKKIDLGNNTIYKPKRVSGYNSYAFVAELSSAGQPTWGISYGDTLGTIGLGIASDISNDVYITGGFQDTTINVAGHVINNPTPSHPTLYLVKFLPDNTVDWHKIVFGYKGLSGYSRTNGFCISMSPCGAIWVSGNMDSAINIDGNTLSSPPGSDPVFIAGYNINGTVAGYANLTSGADDQNGIACDYSGNVYICADYLGSVGSGTFKVGPTTLPPVTGGENLYVAKYASVNTATLDTVSHAHNNLICTSDPLAAFDTLVAPSGYTIYTWGDTNANIATRIVSKPGKYWVTAVGNCSKPTAVDTFRVSYGPDLKFSLGSDSLWNVSSACRPALLTAPEVIPGVTYLWQDGSTHKIDTAKKSGMYTVRISKDGCFFTDSINVNIFYLSAHLRDTFLCKELTVDVPMSVYPPAGASVKWSTGETSAAITAKDTGTYWVAVSEGPCIASDTMRLTHEYCDCWSTAPTAFTPNGDGRNDEFKPVIQKDCPLKNYSLNIYNRYGQRVFFTIDPQQGWDGKLFGMPQDIDSYFWIMEYTGGVKNVKHELKGDVTLIR
jgi:gliding motility-associated-like protein